MIVLRRQLKATTQVTEQIKKDIEHRVWRKQQIESLRRGKLEEYLTLIYVAVEDLTRDMNNRYFDSKEEVDVHALSKATMIQRLYFPELAGEHGALLVAYAAFKNWMIDGMKDLLEKKKGEDSSL